MAGRGGGHLALAAGALAVEAGGPGGVGVTAFSTEGIPGRAPVSGAVLAWRPSGSPIELAGGWMAERETMLGSRASGAFGRLSSGAAFIGFEGEMETGAWRFEAAAELGIARTAARGGMLGGLSPLLASAFALRVERRLDGDASLSLSASQPLRVESGRGRLSLPIGRSKDGRVLRRTVTARLAPDGRQIDLAASWRRRFAPGGELRLGAGWTGHPGHAASAPGELALLAGWRQVF